MTGWPRNRNSRTSIADESVRERSSSDAQWRRFSLVSQVIRTNELQVWFVAEHVVDTPVVRVDA